jgi:hypothetical protein
MYNDSSEITQSPDHVARDAGTVFRAPRDAEAVGRIVRAVEAQHRKSPQVLPAAEPAQRAPSAPDQIRATAARLFEVIDPVDPASYRVVLRRQVRHFFAEAVLGDLDERLATAVTNGLPLYLQGAAEGVGASMLVSDYARAFNFLAHKRGDSRRIAYVPFEEGINTLPKFFRYVARRVRVSPDRVLLRHGGPDDFAAVIFEAAANNNVATFVFDHINKLPPELLGLIGTLMRYANPAYAVEFEPDEQEFTSRPMGVILVDHHKPERLFLHAPDVLLLLEGAHAVLRPYTHVTEVAEAMVQADIGFDQINLGEVNDAAMVKAVMKHTKGLVAHMAPVFARIDAATRERKRERPDLACIQSAIRDHRIMVHLHGVDVNGEIEYLSAASDGNGSEGTEGDEGPAKVPAPRRPAPTPAAARNAELARELRKKDASTRQAKREGRALANKGHITLPRALPRGSGE